MIAASLVAVLLAAAGPPRPAFVDAPAGAGLSFTHDNGMSGGMHLPEIMGPGVGFLDFDGDGDLDVYAVQGGPLDGRPTGKPHDRLFRNDLVKNAGGSRTLRFTDVTAGSGIRASGYGMGVATGDFDGDGRIDVLVTGRGRLTLLRNLGDGRFEDVTEKAGVATRDWSVSATFFDYDRDGRLDLFVANYVTYDLATPTTCFAASSRRDWCGPQPFEPERARLFRNLGNGRFEDVTARALGPHALGAGLGVIAFDADGDGLLDLYVANDGHPNHLFRNEGGRRFRETGLEAGVAVSRAGQPQAGMGLAAADFDADGDEDLFVTNLSGETNTLYVNLGDGLFEDRSVVSGLAPPSRPYTGFGVAWLDVFRSGRLDLVAVNGLVRLPRDGAPPGDDFPLGQAKLFFRSLGGGRYAADEAAGGPAFRRSEVSRGLAVGDVDDDGDLDLLVANNRGPLRLLLNDAAPDGPWIGLRLVEKSGKRDALGARVALKRRGAPDLVRRVRTDGSYASASDPRVLFGLGKGPAAESIEVLWPDGARELFPPPASGRYTTLRQGTGRAVRAGR